MRCKEIRKFLEELRGREISAAVREHLAICPACQVETRNWQLLQEGFQALVELDVPEASFGFVTRLMRRLEEASETGNPAAEFLELVGRRVVLATLLLTLTVLLALAVPATGPLRGAGGADLYVAQAEEPSDPVFGADVLNNPEATPAKLATPDGRGEKGHAALISTLF